MTISVQGKIALKSLCEKLSSGIVKTDEESLTKASFDGLKIASIPYAVISPQKAADAGVILKVANEFKVSVTIKGAGSSLTGGATPIKGGWVLDLSGLNHIKIDQENLVVRCGPWFNNR